MHYASLGDTDLVVSRIGFGALTFSRGNKSLPSVYKVGAALADALVGRAIDAGVTLFDTADVYADGESETLLGAALKPHRDRIVLTTKVGNRSSMEGHRGGLSKQHILKSIDQSLARLGTDRVDLYVAHREDPDTPLEEILESFDMVVRSGKALHIGFSNWTAWNAAAALEIQKANGLARFCHGQMYYSLLGRDVERDMLPMMTRYGLGLTVWSPLAYGFLSGAYARADLSRPDNRFSNFDMLRFDREKGFAVVELVRAMAAERSASVARIAIAWLLARTGVTSVLTGATKMDQLDDNLGAADIVLTDEELAMLDAATKIDPIYATSHWVAKVTPRSDR